MSVSSSPSSSPRRWVRLSSTRRSSAVPSTSSRCRRWSQKKASAGDVRLNGTVVSHEGDAGSPSGLRIQLADNKAYSENPATTDKISIVYHGSVPRRFATAARS